MEEDDDSLFEDTLDDVILNEILVQSAIKTDPLLKDVVGGVFSYLFSVIFLY